MTTRYKQSDVTEGLTGTIHETGHALYEQGRNMSDYAMDLPVNEAAGMAIHESQSLLWERMVALSMPFAEYLLPKLSEKFPDQIGNRTAEDLYRALNVVKMSNLIRVEADEVRVDRPYLTCSPIAPPPLVATLTLNTVICRSRTRCISSAGLKSSETSLKARSASKTSQRYGLPK